MELIAATETLAQLELAQQRILGTARQELEVKRQTLAIQKQLEKDIAIPKETKAPDLKTAQAKKELDTNFKINIDKKLKEAEIAEIGRAKTTRDTIRNARDVKDLLKGEVTIRNIKGASELIEDVAAMGKFDKIGKFAKTVSKVLPVVWIAAEATKYVMDAIESHYKEMAKKNMEEVKAYQKGRTFGLSALETKEFMEKTQEKIFTEKNYGDPEELKRRKKAIIFFEELIRTGKTPKGKILSDAEIEMARVELARERGEYNEEFNKKYGARVGLMNKIFERRYDFLGGDSMTDVIEIARETGKSPLDVTREDMARRFYARTKNKSDEEVERFQTRHDAAEKAKKDEMEQIKFDPVLLREHAYRTDMLKAVEKAEALAYSDWNSY